MQNLATTLYSSNLNFIFATEHQLVCLYAYRTILKATILLLPLLGITWAFGLLAVNQESSVFAWIFTILNSLQVKIIDIIMYSFFCIYTYIATC